MLEGLHATAEPQFLARKVLATPDRPLLGGPDLHVGDGIGMALDGHCCSLPDDLSSRADAALYAAKKAGGETFRSLLTN